MNDANVDGDASAHQVGSPGETGRDRSSARSLLVRLVAYSMLAAILALAGVEVWAQRSYHSTIASLDELQSNSTGNVLLEDALAAVDGWTSIESIEKSSREDFRVVWRSILGEYRIEIHATKKSDKSPKQFFTGIQLEQHSPPDVEIPSGMDLPETGPVGAGDRRRTPSKEKTGG